MKRNCEGFNAGNRHLEVSEGRNKLPKITGVTALGVQRRGVFDLTTSLPLSKLPAHFSANSISRDQHIRFSDDTDHDTSQITMIETTKNDKLVNGLVQLVVSKSLTIDDAVKISGGIISRRKFMDQITLAKDKVLINAPTERESFRSISNGIELKEILSQIKLKKITQKEGCTLFNKGKLAAEQLSQSTFRRTVLGSATLSPMDNSVSGVIRSASSSAAGGGRPPLLAHVFLTSSEKIP